ncbi:MAG: hypothetical protein AMXMBFR64_27520 [Myxococcales bacterium]
MRDDLCCSGPAASRRAARPPEDEWLGEEFGRVEIYAYEFSGSESPVNPRRSTWRTKPVRAAGAPLHLPSVPDRIAMWSAPPTARGGSGHGTYPSGEHHRSPEGRTTQPHHATEFATAPPSTPPPPDHPRV